MLRTDDAGRRTPDAGRWTMDAGPSTPYYKLTGELKNVINSLNCDTVRSYIVRIIIKICCFIFHKVIYNLTNYIPCLPKEITVGSNTTDKV